MFQQNELKEKKKLDWKNVFIMFLIGCIVGTFYEEILHFLKFGNYEQRRALIWGPFNPVYGVGFTIFVIFLYPTWHQRSNFMNFISCSILGGLTEAMSSVITEVLFGIKAWDYSGYFLNIFGKTTVPFALFWGIGGYVIVTYIYPYLTKKLSFIVEKSKTSFCKFMLVFMCLNATMTVLVVYRHICRINHVEQQGVIFQMIDKVYTEDFIYEKFPNWMYEDTKK